MNWQWQRHSKVHKFVDCRIANLEFTYLSLKETLCNRSTLVLWGTHMVNTRPSPNSVFPLIWHMGCNWQWFPSFVAGPTVQNGPIMMPCKLRICSLPPVQKTKTWWILFTVTQLAKVSYFLIYRTIFIFLTICKNLPFFTWMQEWNMQWCIEKHSLS